MELKQIFLPKPNPDNQFSTYGNQMQPQYFFDSPEQAAIFEAQKASVMQIVAESILDYISNEDLCNDDPDMFPKPSMLTGEWYVRSVTFEDGFLYIATALLGTDLGYQDDYLGLDVIFFYDEQQNQFEFDGINSSAL